MDEDVVKRSQYDLHQDGQARKSILCLYQVYVKLENRTGNQCDIK